MDVVLAGEYPGDGQPKPVVFPDPAKAAVRGRRVALLHLERLIELTRRGRSVAARRAIAAAGESGARGGTMRPVFAGYARAFK